MLEMWMCFIYDFVCQLLIILPKNWIERGGSGDDVSLISSTRFFHAIFALVDSSLLFPLVTYRL